MVVAAGTGCADLGCGVPLRTAPGTVAHVPRPGGAPGLSQIVVDAAASVHVLPRADGTVAVDGGTLELGGRAAPRRRPSGRRRTWGRRLGMWCAAPAASCREPSGALRKPVPRDGLPAVGAVAPGVYAIVTHSGVTLGPLLGALAAKGILEGIDLPLLNSYRPDRFAANGTNVPA